MNICRSGHSYIWKPIIHSVLSKILDLGSSKLDFFKFIFILGANLPYPEQFETGKSNVDCIPQSWAIDAFTHCVPMFILL